MRSCQQNLVVILQNHDIVLNLVSAPTAADADKALDILVNRRHRPATGTGTPDQTGNSRRQTGTAHVPVFVDGDAPHPGAMSGH